MNIIKKIPIPIAGLMLALFSLGNLLQDIHPYIMHLFGFFGAIILVSIILKVVLCLEDVKQDFKNPVIVSSSGTFSMSVMLISTYIINFVPSIAYAIWIIGIALHLMLMIYFTYHFIICNFDISTVYPSYWIVFIGITMAAVTSPAHNAQPHGFIFFLIGFISMILTSPLVIYRYFIHDEIPPINKPLICIFTALMSILIVGYLNSTTNINTPFLLILYDLSCIFYIFALYKLIEYRNLDFYPSFAAFTFPFVISALATKGVIKVVGSTTPLNCILTAEIIIAIMIVAYVSNRYIGFLKNS